MRVIPTIVTTLSVIKSVLAQSDGDDSFGSCVRDCIFDNKAPVSCMIDPAGDDSRSLCTCNNFRGDTTEVVDCIQDCASEFAFDYMEMFDESCDELFNNEDSDGGGDGQSSPTDEQSSPSPTRGMDTEEATGVATTRSACVVAVAAGFVAALLY